ncbi:nucleoside-diphosphate kinase [Thermococcus barophilus]|uniref:Nucleoside diphosphate kinase n=1 Tax=Thermococcus barophilus (strain DSM 11836 / MP) TaxID=391623 RepID=F0LMW9_THEBM|nr:nucleoside-diphosphate kinase [Thermococcus barophilus]ADT84098.1 nucleoside diphosphate kinase [Thermococcus barophilus MP]
MADNKVERTLVIIKPDAVVRGLIGEIISRFEKKGLKIVGMKMIHIDRELAERHYEEHKGKPFFNALIDYITKAPSVVMVVEGRYAISVVRKMAGATDPKDAEPGTIRGDLGLDVGDAIYNVVHASDSPESAEREINLYFKPEEIFEYSKAADWFYKTHWDKEKGEWIE